MCVYDLLVLRYTVLCQQRHRAVVGFQRTGKRVDRDDLGYLLGKTEKAIK